MSRTRTRLARLVATAVLAGVLAGCGGAEGRSAGAASPAGPASSTTPGGSDPSVPSPSPAKEPSLPPGDPGTDASGVPSPDMSAPEKRGDGHGHDEPRRVVPDTAMLGAGMVAAMLGGTWSAEQAAALRCTAPAQSAGRRTVSYRSAAGAVVQTISTHRTVAAADAAVASLADRLAGCGWRVGPDPRLGSASLSASDGVHRATVVSADGVSVALVGSGRAVRDEITWSSLVDVAMGTSCAAAADGCH